MRNKVYLGDGAYAEIDSDGALILTTSNGVREDNRIILEPIVWNNLISFVEAVHASREGHDATPNT